MGRGNKYISHVEPHLHEIPEWYTTMSEGQIAQKLGVCKASWELYKTKYPELKEALTKAKFMLSGELRDILRQKAKGYYYTETKTKEVLDKDGEIVTLVEKSKKYAHPDTGAIHLLLKNCDPDWHNEDQKTLQMKREELEMKKQKAAEEAW